MMHMLETDHLGEESVYLRRYFGCTQGTPWGQRLGAKGRAASLAGVEVESAGEEPRGLWLRRQYGVVPERHLADSTWLLLVFIPRWTR